MAEQTSNPKGKTVKVRIAVAVDKRGEWCAGGYSRQADDDSPFRWIVDDLEEGEARYWVAAELSIPEQATAEVAGEVEAADGE